MRSYSYYDEKDEKLILSALFVPTFRSSIDIQFLSVSFLKISLFLTQLNSLSQPLGTHSHTSFWNDEMSSFSGLPPLEMEPLPSLFPFSSCNSATYTRNERPTHDVADVLLSLKNAVLKPGATDSHSCHQTSPLQTSQGYGNSSNALSYTVHHPQILLSPTPHHHYYQCHQNQAQNAYSSSGYYESSSSCAGHQHYPSMSVNVSMNMTMHGYGETPCSQVRFSLLKMF